GGVVVQNRSERGNAAIVHVWCGDGDITQGWGFEFVWVVVHTGVVEFFRIAEVEATVAAKAGKRLRKEENFAALGRFGHGVVVAAVVIAVVGRVGRDDRSFERRNRIDDVLAGEWIPILGEGLWK